MSTRWRSKARTAEAAVLLTMAAGLRRTIPMTKWSPVLGANAAVGPEADRLHPPSGMERTVARHIHAAGKRLPFDPNCLEQATAGQIMLRRRRRPGVVVIGLARNEPGSKWDAHAWLVGQTGAITGAREAKDFHAASMFVP